MQALLMKTCGICRVVLTDDNAGRRHTGSRAGQFQGRCRDCTKEQNRLWSLKNPGERARRSKERYHQDVEAARKRAREWAKEHPEGSRARSQRRKSEYITWLRTLKTGPCKDCGQCFPPVCMDFDHVMEDKKFVLSKGWRFPKELVEAELKKCELVCANCHRIRTEKRGYHG